MRNVRTFFLTKEGVARVDSRSADSLESTIQATLVTSAPRAAADSSAAAGHPILLDAIVSNSGRATWLPSDVALGGVSIGAHLYDEAGQLLKFDLCRAPLAVPSKLIAPGESLRCRLTVPPQPAGRYLLELDCVAAGIAWFAPLGSRAFRLRLTVVGGSPAGY